MVCPRCGHATPVDTGRCTRCGAAFANTNVATGVIVIDTTGLPPGGTFGASTGLNTFGSTVGEPGTADLSDSAAARSGPLKVGQAFSARYHIIKLLGIGGMGAVYQAWDAELSVAVALKVIRIDRRRGSASPEAEKRFKNELLLARQVTHKNVVRIHDLGEIDGIKYITMPYVQGNDLATVLRRDGKLPVARALRFARQICGGLQAAHEAGVVHRDLKPPNVMIGGAGDDEQALIMDFGISASADQTETGGVVGTLEYMAPEQAKGVAVDARADIYAYGLILYEMLTGPRRIASATPQDRVAAMKQRFEAGLPPLRTMDETIPGPLAAVVTRCLEGDPAARFQTSAELTAALAALDGAGELIPETTRLTKPMLAAALAVVILLLGGTYLTTRRLVTPPKAHDVVPVLIADFENLTGDSVFDRSLEQALAVAIERASFITAYPRRDAERVAAQLKPGTNRLDETLARLVSVREGIKVVLSGSIAPRGAGYRVMVKAIGRDGQVITSETSDVNGRNDVLGAVGTLAGRIRRALGDTAPTGQDKDPLTTTSLEAVRLYSVAQDLNYRYRNEDALEQYKRATEIDPNFGRAYAGWANMAFRLGRSDESQAAWKKALALIDRMTEREKYRTFGLYYGTASHNYEKAIDNYATLTRLYPADGAGHNNLALAYFSTLDFQKALQEGRRALDIYPNLLLYRGNYALYAMYASDFATASTEASRAIAQDAGYYPAYLPLAIAALVRNDVAAAQDTYARMSAAGATGASTAALGLADIALYQHRVAEAIDTLKRGIAIDAKSADKAALAAKYVALADAHDAAGQPADAIRAARSAMVASADLEGALAARVLVRLGEEREPIALAASLAQQLQPQKRAYGKILEGEIALAHHRRVDAIQAFVDARKLADLWLVRFDLGIAYLDAGQYAEALSEFELAAKRRGEAAALLLDDRPTFRYAATLPYWLGRAQEELGMSAPAKANYNAFLTTRVGSRQDPLAVDAARRLDAAR
jgi:tetratricopeptide (TPR) repeat protein